MLLLQQSLTSWIVISFGIKRVFYKSFTPRQNLVFKLMTLEMSLIETISFIFSFTQTCNLWQLISRYSENNIRSLLVSWATGMDILCLFSESCLVAWSNLCSSILLSSVWTLVLDYDESFIQWGQSDLGI